MNDGRILYEMFRAAGFRTPEESMALLKECEDIPMSDEEFRALMDSHRDECLAIAIDLLGLKD